MTRAVHVPYTAQIFRRWSSDRGLRDRLSHARWAGRPLC